MNKQALIGIIVVCVLILGGVLFFVLKGSSSSSSNNNSTTGPTPSLGTITSPSELGTNAPSISSSPSPLNQIGSSFYIQCPTTNQYIGKNDVMTSDISSAQIFTVKDIDTTYNYLILSPNVFISNNGNYFTIQYAVGSGYLGGGYIRASSDHILDSAQYTCPACYICITGSCIYNNVAQPVGSLNASTDITSAYATRVPIQ